MLPYALTIFNFLITGISGFSTNYILLHVAKTLSLCVFIHIATPRSYGNRKCKQALLSFYKNYLPTKIKSMLSNKTLIKFLSHEYTLFFLRVFSISMLMTPIALPMIQNLKLSAVISTLNVFLYATSCNIGLLPLFQTLGLVISAMLLTARYTEEMNPISFANLPAAFLRADRTEKSGVVIKYYQLSDNSLAKTPESVHFNQVMNESCSGVNSDDIRDELIKSYTPLKCIRGPWPTLHDRNGYPFRVMPLGGNLEVLTDKNNINTAHPDIGKERKRLSSLAEFGVKNSRMHLIGTAILIIIVIGALYFNNRSTNNTFSKKKTADFYVYCLVVLLATVMVYGLFTNLHYLLKSRELLETYKAEKVKFLLTPTK